MYKDTQRFQDPCLRSLCLSMKIRLNSSPNSSHLLLASLTVTVLFTRFRELCDDFSEVAMSGGREVDRFATKTSLVRLRQSDTNGVGLIRSPKSEGASLAGQKLTGVVLP